jgi:CRP-like cAMP-binding protein
VIRTLLKRDFFAAAPVNVRKNAHIYNCGDHDQSIYVIESGLIKTVMYAKDGKSCLLSIYGAGDIFGELCLFSLERRETAITMSASLVRRIPLASFRATLANEDILEAFLKLLTLRLSEQQQIIANMVTMDSERRLAAALLTLAKKLGKQHDTGISIEEKITQEELSVMVGTTRSRVGYFLKRFRAAGLVQRTPDCYLLINEQHMSRYLDSVF